MADKPEAPKVPADPFAKRIKVAKTKALPKGQYVQKGKIVNAWGKPLDASGKPIEG